jgi:hypothetical protein
MTILPVVTILETIIIPVMTILPVVTILAAIIIPVI